MNSYVCPTIKKAPNRIIQHCGTNDLKSNESPWVIAENIIELAKQMESRETEVFASGIVQRAHKLNGKALEVNRALERECDQMKLKYIYNSNREFLKHYPASYYALWESRSKRGLGDIAIAEG